MSVGSVQVRVPALEGVDARLVELHDHALRLVDRLAPGDIRNLAPGLYSASVTLPSGEEARQVVAVRPGERVTIDLAESREQTSPPPARRPRSPQPPGTVSAREPNAKRSPGTTRHRRTYNQGRGSGATQHAQSGIRERAWQTATFARLISARSGAPMDGLFTPTSITGFDVVMPDRVAVEQDALALQVAAPGAVPQNVMLPVVADTAGLTCHVELSFRNHTPQLTLGSQYDRRLRTVTRYMRSGAPKQAAAVAGDAQQLLYDKRKDPIAAALGGYALLRLGEHGRMHEWPTNLARWFPALADGAVVAGELCARRGDVMGARSWALEAARRGLPIFSEGLSLLAAGLRREVPAIDGAEGPNVIESPHVERILATAAWSDLDALYVSFAAADLHDPVGSQRPPATSDPRERWQHVW